MQYPPPPPVPSDVDPATLAALPLEFIAGEQQAELMAAIKALGDSGDFPEARVEELTQAHERAALPEREMLLKYTIPQLNLVGCGVFGVGPSGAVRRPRTEASQRRRFFFFGLFLCRCSTAACRSAWAVLASGWSGRAA